MHRPGSPPPFQSKSPAPTRANCVADSGGGRHGPTTLEADRILTDKGIFIIPTFWRIQAGSSFRILNGCRMQRFFWKAKDIQDRLQDIITSAFHRNLQFSVQRRTTMRMAALMSGHRQGGASPSPTRLPMMVARPDSASAYYDTIHLAAIAGIWMADGLAPLIVLIVMRRLQDLTENP